MKTVTKIALAGLAYRLVHFGRSLRGMSDLCIVERDGISYELDLQQGIDFAIYLGNAFERNTRYALASLIKPSWTVLDIGANIGAHTLHLAKCVGNNGRVLAFEPTEFAYRKLMRNLELNPALSARVIPHHCFLAPDDESNVPEAVYSSWPLTQNGSTNARAIDIHAEHLGHAMRTETARARSVDSILAEHDNPDVRLVKLDVDGFECDVLRGATKMMRERKPIFVMELAPYVLRERGASLEQMFSLFSVHGYHFYHERTRQPLTASASEYEKSIAVGESINVIARVD